MSAFYSASTVSVRGGLRARPAVLPNANQVLMSFLHTVSTLSVRRGLWVSSVHTFHVPKPVLTFVFKVLRNGLLRYMLFTCPNLC